MSIAAAAGGIWINRTNDFNRKERREHKKRGRKFLATDFTDGHGWGSGSYGQRETGCRVWVVKNLKFEI
jgi:hypothetical protein